MGLYRVTHNIVHLPFLAHIACWRANGQLIYPNHGVPFSWDVGDAPAHITLYLQENFLYLPNFNKLTILPFQHDMVLTVNQNPSLHLFWAGEKVADDVRLHWETVNFDAPLVQSGASIPSEMVCNDANPAEIALQLPDFSDQLGGKAKISLPFTGLSFAFRGKIKIEEIVDC